VETKSGMEGMVRKIVVVTGGAGFIGAHLVELLLKKKYKVVVIDIQKPSKNYFFLNKLNKKSTYRIVDITKKKQVDDFFASVHPNYVIHLAAQPIVESAYYHPYNMFETNIMGTINILEGCRKDSHIERIVIASSDKAYGKTKTAYTEKSPLKGDHPYDVSKSCEDLIAQTYAKTYGLPIVITRFGNVYGEGDMHFDRIIPGICKSLITGRPLEIRSNGKYIRDYIYVKDVTAGYIRLMETKRNILGEAFNFGSKDTSSVLDVIKVIEKALNKKVTYKILNTAQNEIPYQTLDYSKVKKILGWKPKSSIKLKARTIFRWYDINY
jgi:CDP-glucose 4,6-dehydratase